MDADELDRNAQVRNRRATDSQWRERELERRRAYKQRVASGEVVVRHRYEPQEAGAPQRDILDYWLNLWLRLNSESEEVVASAKAACRKRFEMLVHLNQKERDRLHGVTSESGLADDD